MIALRAFAHSGSAAAIALTAEAPPCVIELLSNKRVVVMVLF
jgi:hypothetical protein